jgi:1,4-alpha-glucan branching enzyme
VAKKSYGKSARTCRVTFELPPAVEADSVSVVGDFNQWQAHTHRLQRRKDGRFSLTLSLPVSQAYRYRFLVDGKRWENDWAADDYVPNEFGTDDSLILV